MYIIQSLAWQDNQQPTITSPPTNHQPSLTSLHQNQPPSTRLTYHHSPSTPSTRHQPTQLTQPSNHQPRTSQDSPLNSLNHNSATTIKTPQPSTPLNPQPTIQPPQLPPGFLSLQNFLCGSGGHADAARRAALDRGLLRLVAVSAAEPSKSSVAALLEDAPRRRLEPWHRWLQVGVPSQGLAEVHHG